MLQILEIGGLAATTASVRDPRLVELLTDTLNDADGGWLPLKAEPPLEHVTFLAMDVEMIERRSDKLRVPVSAAVLRCDLRPGGDEPSISTLFLGLVDPSAIDASWVRGDVTTWDYKESITGLSHDELVQARDTGSMTSLRALQRLVAASLHGATFIVGHNVQADLRCLRLHGACLQRRVIDTQCVFRRADGTAPALKHLVAKILAAEAGADSEWHVFQGASHDPRLDAEAPLQLVLREVRLLSEQPQRRIGTWSGGASPAGPPAPAPAPACKASYHVPDADAGRVIGKAGGTIRAMREMSGAAVTLGDRSKGPPVQDAGALYAPPAPPRLLELSGSAEAVARATQMLLEVCPSAVPA